MVEMITAKLDLAILREYEHFWVILTLTETTGWDPKRLKHSRKPNNIRTYV
jgi:hypothetical protein